MEDVKLLKASHTGRGYLMARDIWIQDVTNDCVDQNDACQMRLRAKLYVRKSFWQTSQHFRNFLVESECSGFRKMLYLQGAETLWTRSAIGPMKSE